MGQGAGLKSLSVGTSNIRFYPLQPYEDLPASLALADCHLVIQKAGVADAVLPSKLTNILSVGGQAVITAEKETEFGKLCIEYAGIAELVEPKSAQAIEAGIRNVLEKPKHNRIAEEYAKNNLDKQAVLESFESQLEILAG